jgi:predicted ATPase
MPDILSIPHIEYLRVQNYRALRDLELKNITSLAVFVGPNGSGKSTIFDVFAFLSECFSVGLRKAWDKRGRFKELRSRGQTGPIQFEFKYREKKDLPPITYHLSIDEKKSGPYVADEWLQWRRGKQYGQPYRFLDFQSGKGKVISGDSPEEKDIRIEETLDSPDVLAVNALGQLARNPRVAALRRFITGWYLSYLTADSTRGVPEAGPQERLSATGDNLPNVIQYLKEQHPGILDHLLNVLASRVPQLQKVDAEFLADGRLLLRLKDAPFEEPILAKFASDGTLKMLAYLTVLYDPNPPLLIGIEEPENHLHPRLLPALAEECRQASCNSQMFVTTHSPFFVNGLQPEETWVLYRDQYGFSQAVNTTSLPAVVPLMRQGALLGQIWMEGHFGVGDPLTKSGGVINNNI